MSAVYLCIVIFLVGMLLVAGMSLWISSRTPLNIHPRATLTYTKFHIGNWS